MLKTNVLPKTMPYTSLNGNMFSFLSPDGKMGLRLSKADREAFIEKYKTKLMEQHGTIMKEYVEVPDDLLEDTKTISAYLKKSPQLFVASSLHIYSKFLISE